MRGVRSGCGTPGRAAYGGGGIRTAAEVAGRGAGAHRVGATGAQASYMEGRP